MGWKTQDAYELAERADRRTRLSSLSPADRRRLHLRQVLRVLVLLGSVGLIVFLIFR